MSINKNKYKENFFIVSNDVFKINLSDKAFKIYCYLLSKPDNWQIINADIKKNTGIKDNHTLSIKWKELLEIGLITRTKKINNANNQFIGGYDYEIVDIKELTMKNSEMGKIPDCEKSPNTKNPQNINKTDLLNKTNIINKTNKESFNFDGFNEIEINSIKDWLLHNKQRTKKNYTEIGLKGLRTKMLKFKERGILIETIENSIANNYNGLFEPLELRGKSKVITTKKGDNYVPDFI